MKKISYTLIFILSFLISNAFASNVAGLTGTYACVTNKNFAAFTADYLGFSNIGTNALAILNFDNSTISGVHDIVNNFGNSNTNPPTTTISTISGNITVTASSVAGIYKIAVSNLIIGGNSATGAGFFMIPANSSNTLFLNSDTTTTTVPETGVCQKQ